MHEVTVNSLVLDWPEAEGGNAARARARITSVTLASGQVIDLPDRGVTVIVGANNAGKSTLLSHLNLFLQYGQSQVQAQQPRLVDTITLTREVAVPDLLHWFSRNATVIQQSDEVGGPLFALNNMHVQASSVRAGAHSVVYDGLQDLYHHFVSFADATTRLNQSFEVAARAVVGEPAMSPLQRFQDNRELFDQLSSMCERVFDRPLLLDDYPGAVIRIRGGSVSLPIPARNEPLGAFGEAVGRLPMLSVQGDGMRSFFGLMIPMIGEERQIVLVDEPEAFLHPPQARALGRELGQAAATRDKQIIVSTHDKDFISGLLDSESDLTVVRLIRTDGYTERAQLSSKKLREVWDDRNLRYSNVLNGLFAQLVIICESDQDCRFYEAVLDAYVTANADNELVHTIPVSDILFLPSNGKGGFVNLIPTLDELAVPTVVVADIDLLRSRNQAESVFSALGGEWDTVATDYTVATESLRRPARPRTAANVLTAINGILQARVADDCNAAYDANLKSVIDDQLRLEMDPWKHVKESGIVALRGDAHAAGRSLLSSLDQHGLVLVQVGELEGFAPQHPKGNGWLPKAIADRAHAAPAAQELAHRILGFHQRSLEP